MSPGSGGGSCEHKVVLVVVAASVTATSLVAAALYAWYLKRRVVRRMEKDMYETEKRRREYLVLHYGTPREVISWDFGPTADVDFSQRCADLCVKHCKMTVSLTAVVTICKYLL